MDLISFWRCRLLVKFFFYFSSFLCFWISFVIFLCCCCCCCCLRLLFFFNLHCSSLITIIHRKQFERFINFKEESYTRFISHCLNSFSILHNTFQPKLIDRRKKDILSWNIELCWQDFFKFGDSQIVPQSWCQSNRSSSQIFEDKIKVQFVDIYSCFRDGDREHQERIKDDWNSLALWTN